MKCIDFDVGRDIFIAGVSGEKLHKVKYKEYINVFSIIQDITTLRQHFKAVYVMDQMINDGIIYINLNFIICLNLIFRYYIFPLIRPIGESFVNLIFSLVIIKLLSYIGHFSNCPDIMNNVVLIT